MKPKLSWLFAAAVAAAALGVHAEAAPTAHACLAPATWSILDGDKPQPASVTAILSAMAKRDVVLLGELHDNDDHHRWQLQALAALQAQRPNMVIGFEMFPRRVQPVLDRWVADELTFKQFLEESDWDKVWNVPAELYLPLFQFARINRIPMLALNVDWKLNQAIKDKGWDAVPVADREGVGRAAPPSEAYRDSLFEIYREHRAMDSAETGKTHKSDHRFRHFVESQTTWDRAMAEALASRLAAAGKGEPPLLVGIMGSGHINYGYGVPHQLRDLGVKNIGSLLPVPYDTDCKDLRPGLADAVFALPKPLPAPAERPRLGVRLEEGEDGVRIAEVMADSLAEKSGLKKGDRLLEVAGQPATKALPVSASIRRQPGGSWLPMRVKRGEETFDVVIKFPVQR